MPFAACCASSIAWVAVVRLGLDCWAVSSQPPTSSATSTDTSERPRTILRRSAGAVKHSSGPPGHKRQHCDAELVLAVAAEPLGKRQRAQLPATLLARPGRRLRDELEAGLPYQPQVVGRAQAVLEVERPVHHLPRSGGEAEEVVARDGAVEVGVVVLQVDPAAEGAAGS